MTLGGADMAPLLLSQRGVHTITHLHTFYVEMPSLSASQIAL